MSAIQGAVPLVVVEDDGGFHLYRAETELLLSDERPESSRCVIDRSGQYRHLLAGESGRLALGRSLGPADHYSLRQQFLRQQHAHPEAHRLLRRYPSTRAEVLGAIFEELELEDPADAQDWTIHEAAAVRRCAGLRAVDAQLTHGARAAVVTDPFGHRYLAHMPADRALVRRLGDRPLYVEIGTRAPSLRPDPGREAAPHA